MTTSTIETVPGVSRADWVAGPPQGQWTYDDYAKIPDDGNRYEVLEGVLYMTPAPTTAHQRANAEFITRFTIFVKDVGLGEVLGPPLDVKLTMLADPVQPDVVVVLKDHLERLTRAGMTGAPDLIVEISSPGTASYDRHIKRNLYEAAGVTEYWIADPDSKTIEILLLVNGKYVSQGVFIGQSRLPTQIISELPTPVERFFM